MKKVVIFGVGEFAEVATVYLEKDSPYEVAAFTVDSAHITQDKLLNRPIVPFEQLKNNYAPDEYTMFVATGFRGLNQDRELLFNRCKEQGYTLISYINSQAAQWGHVSIGENSFVFENNVLQPFVNIGDNCILWSGNHIGHHVQIGDHCFITSHVVISGGTTIGHHCFIGVNATIGDHLKIAPNCVIGAGSLVLQDTEELGAYIERGTEKSRVAANRLGVFKQRRKTA